MNKVQAYSVYDHDRNDYDFYRISNKYTHDEKFINKQSAKEACIDDAKDYIDLLQAEDNISFNDIKLIKGDVEHDDFACKVKVNGHSNYNKTWFVTTQRDIQKDLFNRVKANSVDENVTLKKEESLGKTVFVVQVIEGDPRKEPSEDDMYTLGVYKTMDAAEATCDVNADEYVEELQIKADIDMNLIRKSYTYDPDLYCTVKVRNDADYTRRWFITEVDNYI